MSEEEGLDVTAEAGLESGLTFARGEFRTTSPPSVLPWNSIRTETRLRRGVGSQQSFQQHSRISQFDPHQ